MSGYPKRFQEWWIEQDRSGIPGELYSLVKSLTFSAWLEGQKGAI